ncbi:MULTISPECIES: RHS repeat-associated core domain-containing protein [Chryseobacterium]|uniref:RHS repeat-associated protein n=1 Tax=Chryseobacterium camelliae TaxID=1265445 RepID=A0ABU0TD22_9FLAO|nr:MULTISPECIES: RHS repeat-associated core domain-containing protein [Chryseobacterium]MDT3407282.1 RHS repeat-associated protein [Pseudacidovorax intermedius]MDQ1094929.1 RHS repeat-associated protein [Chryseobacterium camelliae]MDQ1098868.1 RHS repeat-associated protein [Chryseobacterium sp. SORGH_AS_1048]MDR6086218.1 RHS repeat-associated protein [Chryseobacterium sp. SORGH_AS_0909]MDR6130587.1 RHS repeat-associated protein [Chryseobacterium sp. SORGH_AS_1175]
MDNGTGVEVIEENNYYPFGLKHEGYNGLTGNPSYQYKYNGKELQAETGMYDYGARFYMPDIGRWGVVDPLAETSRRWSTYTYAYNNPTMFVDPDGMQNTDWYQKQKDGTYKNIKKSTDLVILDEKGKKVPTFTSAGPLGGYNEDYAEGVNEARNQGIISKSDAKEASNIATIYGIEKGGEGTAGAIVGAEGLYSLLKNPKGAWEALKSIKSLFSSGEKASLALEISASAEANGIKSAQKSINPSIVANYYEQMVSGTYKSTGGAGYVYEGKYILTEGNHRMNAALQYGLKTGYFKYVEEIITKGNFHRANPSNYGIKIYKLPTK